MAPFDGIIIKRMKNPGESVRANEAVVELGNLNRLAADAYVPLEYAYRVKEGQVVEIQPRTRSRHAAADREEAVPRQDHLRRPPDPAGRPRPPCRIRAEFENPGWELRPGLVVQMTIFLTPEAAAADPQVDRRGPGRRALQ